MKELKRVSVVMMLARVIRWAWEREIKAIY